MQYRLSLLAGFLASTGLEFGHSCNPALNDLYLSSADATLAEAAA